MARVRVRVGINYVPKGGRSEKRADPGDLVSDIPDRHLRWMLEQGIVERLSDRSDAEDGGLPADTVSEPAEED